MRKSNVSCAISWILLRRRLLEKRIIFERNNYHRNPGIDWRLWKSARIHLFSKRIIVMEMMNRNHSKYWIVNHWNRSTLVIIVSMILLANLNWRIYQSCNIYLLIHLEGVIQFRLLKGNNWAVIINWIVQKTNHKSIKQ